MGVVRKPQTAWVDVPAGDRPARCRESSMDVIQSASQAPRVAIESAPTQPGVTGTAVPGHDPVMECQSQRRQVLVGRHDGRQVFE